MTFFDQTNISHRECCSFSVELSEFSNSSFMHFKSTALFIWFVSGAKMGVIEAGK